MKKILTTFILLLSHNAFSHSLTCQEINPIADSGYAITFSKSLRVATVEEITFVGARVIAKLICNHSDSNTGVTISGCYEKYIRDGGYSIYFESTSPDGTLKAVLNEVTIMGSNPIDEFTCKLTE